MSDNENVDVEYEKNSEMDGFVDLINCISSYYYYRTESDQNINEGDGDEWKLKTGYIQPKKNLVPDNIDKLVERSFKVQLKKFLK